MTLVIADDIESRSCFYSPLEIALSGAPRNNWVPTKTNEVQLPAKFVPVGSFLAFPLLPWRTAPSAPEVKWTLQTIAEASDWFVVLKAVTDVASAEAFRMAFGGKTISEKGGGHTAYDPNRWRMIPPYMIEVFLDCGTVCSMMGYFTPARDEVGKFVSNPAHWRLLHELIHAAQIIAFESGISMIKPDETTARKAENRAREFFVANKLEGAEPPRSLDAMLAGQCGPLPPENMMTPETSCSESEFCKAENWKPKCT